jgi:hypothetical protein
MLQVARLCLRFELSSEVSRLSKLKTNFRKHPKFSAAPPLRMRLSSSANTTSKTQCMLSICQCPRVAVVHNA